VSYQPEQRSPNAQRRQISVNSNKQGGERGMLPNNLIANLNAHNNALNGMAVKTITNKYEVNLGEQDSYSKMQSMTTYNDSVR
jgi:hypothetical protein